MFVLNLVFLALLAASPGQSGIPRYIQGQWILSDENLQYEDTDGQSVAVEESIWSVRPPGVVEQVAVEDQNLMTTPEPHVMKEQASDEEEEEESAVWKIVLVAAILLVSIVGSLSMAYYLCVWRGGRIYYQPQKAIQNCSCAAFWVIYCSIKNSQPFNSFHPHNPHRYPYCQMQKNKPSITNSDLLTNQRIPAV